MINDVADLPFDFVDKILRVMSSDQLAEVERNSPHLRAHTNPMWKRLVQTEFSKTDKSSFLSHRNETATTTAQARESANRAAVTTTKNVKDALFGGSSRLVRRPAPPPPPSADSNNDDDNDGTDYRALFVELREYTEWRTQNATNKLRLARARVEQERASNRITQLARDPRASRTLFGRPAPSGGGGWGSNVPRVATSAGTRMLQKSFRSTMTKMSLMGRRTKTPLGLFGQPRAVLPVAGGARTVAHTASKPLASPLAPVAAQGVLGKRKASGEGLDDAAGKPQQEDAAVQVSPPESKPVIAPAKAAAVGAPLAVRARRPVNIFLTKRQKKK